MFISWLWGFSGAHSQIFLLKPDKNFSSMSVPKNLDHPESPSSFQITTTASVTNATSSINNQSSSSIVNAQNQNSISSQSSNSKPANPSTKISPPKLSPLSPTGSSLSPPTYPAVLGRGATLPQKSKVPPPVPPRGSPKPKRDLPPNRGNFFDDNITYYWV